VTTSNKQPATSNKQPATSIQHQAKWLFTLYALFVFYAVAMPFQLDLSRSGLQYRWERVELVPFLTIDYRWLSIGDAVANILLFVPFGFFLHSWCLARRVPQAHGELHPAAFSLRAALLFSAAIECMQLCLNGRNSSINDIMNNVAGAYFGVRFAGAYPEQAATKWNEFKSLTRTHPLLALWMAMMALQTLLALAPIDFTLKILRLTLIGTLAIAVGLGALAVVCWRHYWRHSSRKFWQLLTATICFYPFLLILQFSVQPVHPNPLFLLAGVVGVIIGMLLMGLVRGK
jgi:glycopeptide antibiotics resistance protein